MPELETIVAPLAAGYKQLETDSFQTSAELTTERRTNEALRNQGFYTANFSMYTVKEGKEYLYFGGIEANPILGNIDEACRQLINNQNYKLDAAKKQAVLDSAESGLTLKIRLAELKLQRVTDEYGYFEIDTENYDRLNPSQRALAERVYGQGDNFIENMEMIRNEGKIKQTRIYTLMPGYVKKNAKDSPITRAGLLIDSYYNSNFIAIYRSVSCDNSLRGVSRSGSLEVAAGDETQKLASNQPENSPPRTIKPKRTELKEQEYLLNQRKAEMGDSFSDRFALLEFE